MQNVAIIDQHLIVITSCHHYFLDSKRSEYGQLPTQNRILERNLSHALRVLFGYHTHSVAQATVEDQGFHISIRGWWGLGDDTEEEGDEVAVGGDAFGSEGVGGAVAGGDGKLEGDAS